jgi:hypothetical protein
MTVLDGTEIVAVFNIISFNLYSKITKYLLHSNCEVVMEDIRPYSTPLTPQIIDTAKFIGEASYRLQDALGKPIQLMPRSDVKKWVYDTFPNVCAPYIQKKMMKKVFDACEMGSQRDIKVYGNGELWKPRKGSFVYVDDKMVTEAMKSHYKIPMPPPGSGYQYGLKDDAWQALAVATCWQAKQQTQP